MKHDVLSTFRMLAILNLIDVKFQSSEQNSLCKWELSKVKQSKCPLTWNVYAHIKGETTNEKRSEWVLHCQYIWFLNIKMNFLKNWKM